MPLKIHIRIGKFAVKAALICRLYGAFSDLIAKDRLPISKR